MLNLGAPESGWQEILPGVRVQFAPIGIKTVRAARIACGEALKDSDGDFQEASDALSCELIRRGIIAWEGVGDAEGRPLDVSPDAIELFIANPDAFEAAERVYVQPWLTRDMEKNGSAGSSNGIFLEATPVDDTASKAAPQATASDASPIRKLAKPDAPTSKTSQRPKKAKPSLKS